MNRLEDLANLGIAIALGKSPAERISAEEILRVAEAVAKYVHGASPLPAFGESAQIELPSTLNNFRDLAKRVSEHTTEMVHQGLDVNSTLQVWQAYDDVYKQLSGKEAPKNDRAAYVASGLRILDSLERLAREWLGAEVPQELNFANYFVVPVINRLLRINHVNASILMEKYIRPKSFTVNVKNAIIGKCLEYFNDVDLVMGEGAAPEFVSEKLGAVTRIVYKPTNEAKNEGEWLVYTEVDGLKFWGIKTHGMDESSADYAAGFVRTSLMERALKVARAANSKVREAYT